MGVVFYLMERLRQSVGTCWDYCVIWKLNEDPWLLECVDCCCGGTYQNTLNVEDDLVFPVSSTPIPCKDVMFPHSRMRSCELLSQVPPSLPLDGINAEVLITNQPKWLKNAKILDLSTTTEEIIDTKVLIPVPGGLVEFYASKMVPEDQSLIDFVVSQCSAISEQEVITNNINQLNPNTSLLNNQTDFPPYSPSTALANMNLSCADATADRIRICNSAMNFLQQFSYLTETRSNKDDLLLEGGDDHPDRLFQSDPSQQQFGGLEGSIENNDNPLGNGNDHHFHHQQQNEEQEKGPLKHELVRPDSGSDSEPIDDEDDSKYTRRKNGKGNQSKNLVAERKRRKKLNERLYMLRSLVPKISKLDRAAILGDAIEYVMELQKQEKDLQTELEQNSDDEDVGSCSLISNPTQRQNNNIPMEYSNFMGANKFIGVDNYENEEPSNGFFVGSSSRCPGENNLKRSHDDRNTYDKGQQMEVQVEVAHLEGNEFFIKVFGEQRRGGFVRLMEALDSLGLEITTVNVTSCISLISYVFTVEKKDSEIVQAEYLRESLLEMTRNQSGDWTEMAKAQGHHQLDLYQQQYFHQPHNHHFHQFQ